MFRIDPVLFVLWSAALDWQWLTMAVFVLRALPLLLRPTVRLLLCTLVLHLLVLLYEGVAASSLCVVCVDAV